MRRAVAVVLMVLGVFLVPARADALTANQKFIKAVYADLMLRAPSTDEMTWWTAYLTSGSRSAMLASLIDSPAFEVVWVAGVNYQYLEDYDSEWAWLSTQESALAATGDFVDTELRVIESAEYYSLAGGTNTAFVEKTYQDILLRNADPSGLAFWVGRLNAGTSTRRAVANAHIRSSEGAGVRVAGPSSMTSCTTTEITEPASVESGSYCIILDRMADPSGESYWTAQLTGSGQLPTLWSSLASSNEYFNDAQLRF